MRPLLTRLSLMLIVGGALVLAAVTAMRLTGSDPGQVVVADSAPVATTEPLAVPIEATAEFPTVIPTATAAPVATTAPTLVPTPSPVPTVASPEPALAADPVVDEEPTTSSLEELDETPILTDSDSGPSAPELRDGEDGSAAAFAGEIDESPRDAQAPLASDRAQAADDTDTDDTEVGTNAIDAAAPTATAIATAVPSPTEVPAPTSTPAPTATSIAVPTTDPVPTITAGEPTPTPVGGFGTSAGEGWMYVTSTDGLYVRAEPAGAIHTVLDHGTAVYATGRVMSVDNRFWMELLSPVYGWAALEFLSPTAPAPLPTPTAAVVGAPPTAADWAALRECESGGRYTVVDPSGLYHGAYQFLPSTWDGLARLVAPELVGVLPSQASPADQDRMALQLFALEGARPWPVCGQHLL